MLKILTCCVESYLFMCIVRDCDTFPVTDGWHIRQKTLKKQVECAENSITSVSYTHLQHHQPIFVKLGTQIHNFILHNSTVFEIRRPQKNGDGKQKCEGVKIVKKISKVHVGHQIKKNFNQNLILVYSLET